MNEGFSMTGMEAVLSMLERAEEGALYSAASVGMYEGLDAICSEAKILCPKDTGALQDSISVRMTQDRGEVYAGAPYAAHVEMGTAESRAQPFLYPAMKAKESDALLGVREAVSRQVRGEA